MSRLTPGSGTGSGSSSDITSIIPGTGATNLGKAEDTPHASGDTGIAVWGVRNDAATSFSGTDGDYTPIALTAQGYPMVVGNVASAATDAGNPLKIGGKYNLSAITLSDGQRGDAQLDANGYLKDREQYAPAAEDNANSVIGFMQRPVASSTYSPTLYKDAGTVTKANVKATAGNVFSIRVTNANTAIRYFQLHNKATAPAAAESAQMYFLIPAGSATQPAILELDSSWFAPSEYFVTGIGWAISTTATTFTDSATAGDHNVIIRYF